MAIELTSKLGYYVCATKECIPALESCSQNRTGPVFYQGVLEQILDGEFKCFRVDAEQGPHPWNYVIYYQGCDLDRAMREFTSAETSRVFASADGQNWRVIGNWVRAAATWGSSTEHAYGHLAAE